eukprot:scaffold330_cov246-Pinguiococcus_pyrenoidosus.AAC.1
MRRLEEEGLSAGEESRERAFLVGVELKSRSGDPNAAFSFSLLASMGELAELARTAGLNVVGADSQSLLEPNPRSYIGSGKVREVRSAMKALRCQTVIVDEELSPGQQRNLEVSFGGEEAGIKSACEHQGRDLAGRAGARDLPPAALDQTVDAPGAPVRRLWKIWRGGASWTGREADRGRSPSSPRPHQRPEQGARRDPAPPANAAQEAPQGRHPGHCARRVHQRGQEQRAQRTDQGGSAERGHALRHAGPDHSTRAAPGAAGPPGRALHGHGGLHPEAAHAAHRGVPSDAGGSEGSGRHRARD